MADSKKATGGKRFSVYAGLGDSPEISWSTVASTLSEDLTSMRETKMKERAAIEKATNEQMEALNKLQDVNSRSLGRVVLEGSSQSKEELRLRMDLVRKGLLKPADYKLFMQEQKSGYSNFSNIVKTYDQWHTKAMEKVNAGTATDAEIFVLKQIESFGNLNNKKIYTNPANGQIQVVTMKKDADGKYTKMPSAKDNPNSFSNPGSMLDLMSYDGGVKKELRDEAKKITDSLATIITSSVRNGSVTRTSDFRQIFDDPASLKEFGITDEDITTFDQWLDSQVNTLTATDADMAQILSQKGYQYNDPKAANYIKTDLSGGQLVFELTDEQKAKARQIAKNEINLQIDSEITKTAGFKPDSNDVRESNIRKEKLEGVDFTNRLISSNFDDAKTAQNMLESDPLYKDIEKIVMKDIDGNTVEKTSNDFDVNKVDVIEFTMQVDGKMTPLNVETKKKKPDGTLMRDKNNNPINKSGEEIVRDILTKLKVPAAQVQSYIEEHKKSGKSFNNFNGIPTFNRTLGELNNVSGIKVNLGKSSFPVGQGVTEVLRNEFDEDDKLTKLIENYTTANPDETDDKKAELKSYKWGLISNMVDNAFNSKGALAGRRSFKIQRLDDGNIKVNYNNKTLDIGITYEQIANNGQLLIEKIQEAIKSSNNEKPAAGDDIFD